MSPQTAFICNCVTGLPTSSGRKSLPPALKANGSRLLVGKKPSQAKRKQREADGESAARGRTRCHTQKLHWRRLSLAVQTAEKVTPRRGSFAVCCTWQSRLSTTMPSERSTVSAGGQQEFTRKALQDLTVHRMRKVIETWEP